jgi:hypothetical protein
MIAIMPKKIFAIASMTALMRSPNSPRRAMAKPVRIDISRICRRSPLGEGADEGFGDDRQQMGDQALLLGAMNVACNRLGIESRRIDVEALAGLEQLPDQKSEPERQRRHRLEIEQRLDPDTADLFEVAHRADAVHDRAEDDRPDHHLDERDEAVAERLEGDRRVGEEMPDQDADRDGDEHLNVENGVPGARGFAHGVRPARKGIRSSHTKEAAKRRLQPLEAHPERLVET